jgi:hypothetical protein
MEIYGKLFFPFFVHGVSLAHDLQRSAELLFNFTPLIVTVQTLYLIALFSNTVMCTAPKSLERLHCNMLLCVCARARVPARLSDHIMEDSDPSG